MSNNYFDKLSALARKLDKGIEELEDAWQIPQHFVGGYADITEETEARIALLQSSIQRTQDGVNELIRAKETSDLEIDTLIEEAEVKYDYLKQDVDNLETVFKEYGYHYDKDDVNDSGIKEIEITSNSNLSARDDSMEEIVFTPDLSWRCKKKSIDKTSLNGNENLSEKSAIINQMEPKESKKARQLNFINNGKESLSTPISIITFKNTMQMKFLTPLRDRPPDPIYSKYFYSAHKKNPNHQF